MPLVDPKPPLAIEHAFKRGLEDMIHIDRAPAGLKGRMVQRICILTLDDAARGKDFSAIRPGPWRFVAGNERGIAIAITIPTPPRGHRARMNCMEVGRGIHQSFAEVDLIRKLPAVRHRPYELRRLKLPGIIGAFWLVPQDGSDKDLLVPYATVVPGLKGMKPYSIKVFLEHVRSVAKNRLDSSKGRI